MRPAAHLLFLTRQEKKAKEGDPTVRVPFASLQGNLRCSRSRCAAELTSLLCSSVQTAAASQSTKRGHPSVSTRTPTAVLLGTARGAAIRAIAALGPQYAGAARRESKAERSDGPCGLPPPSGCAWGGVLAGWRLHRRMQSLRDLTGRGCLNGAAQQQSEFCGPPRQRPDPSCPVATAKGSQPVGSPFFWVLFFGEAKKSASAAGPRPGLPKSIKPDKHQKP